ncbi:MAG: TetR/AcrR family transcriptional regulator [Actinomycetota bacterium]|nr:TetR/AcrR family transcriptional regulator [Actinomycetota bacterium]
MARSRTNARSATSTETRARILDATLETIRTDGIVGASARAIARNGDFNQASIYYHFGSVNEAVLTAVRAMSEERLSRYQSKLDGVDTLPELVGVAEELHREDVASGNIRVLAQVLAGSVGDDELSEALAEVFAPWSALVAGVLGRVVEGTPLEGALPLEALAEMITAQFLGIELCTLLRPQQDHGEALFTSMRSVAVLVEAVLQSGSIPQLPSPGSTSAA